MWLGSEAANVVFSWVGSELAWQTSNDICDEILYSQMMYVW